MSTEETKVSPETTQAEVASKPVSQSVPEKKEEPKVAESTETAKVDPELEKLRARVAEMEAAEESRKKKAEEAELNAQELLKKREEENRMLREKSLTSEVAIEKGYTHSIFKYAQFEKAGEELTRAEVEAGLESFQKALDGYFDLKLKAVPTPGSSTPPKSEAAIQKTVSAAERFGFINPKVSA